MSVIELDGTLDSRITDDVSVSEVLSEDTSTGLLLLCDLIGVTLGILSVVVISVLAAGAGDGELVGTELGVVEEKSGLCGRGLLEGDLGDLDGAFGVDLDVRDLSTIELLEPSCGA